MLVTALWYAEQQFRWSDKHFSSTKENQPWHFATAPFYLAPMAIIASSPYLGIASAAGKLSWHAQAQAERSFMARSFGLKISKRQALKFGVTKVASRFIPVVGWALLAADLYFSGKWIYENL